MFNDIHERTEFFGPFCAFAADCDFTVFGGDILNDVRGDGSVEEKLISRMEEVRRATGVPCEFVRGNHETRGPKAAELLAELGFAGGRGYRAKTVGGVRFVFLDTCENRRPNPKEAERFGLLARILEEEREWLMREIASAEWREARARIVILHIPPPIVNPDKATLEKAPVQRSTRYEPVVRLHETLRNAGVTAMFSGHIHIAAFDEPTEERPYPIIVGGGSHTFEEDPLTEALLTRCDFDETGFEVRQFALDGAVRHRRRYDI